MCHVLGVVGPAYDKARLAVHDCLARSPTLPRHLGHARCRRLEEDDAEALLLEPAPPVAAEHGEHVRARVERRQPLVLDPPQQTDRGPRLAHEAVEPRPIAAGPGDGDGEIRTGRCQAGRGRDQGVHAFAGHEAAHAHEQPALDG